MLATKEKRELEIDPGDNESSSKMYLSSSLNQSKTKTNEVYIQTLG